MKWISVNNKKTKPTVKQHKRFLVSNGKEISIAFWAYMHESPTVIYEWWFKDYKIIENVTHWMPLPAPPEDK